VPLPKPVRADIRPLAPEEVRALLTAAAGTRYHALYVVALDSGARVGELLAWTRDDWHPATRELTITKTLTVNRKGEAKAKEPKTKASRRKVVLSEQAAVALEAHRDRQRADGLKTGIVFAAARGGYTFRHYLIRYTFRPALSRARLPAGVRFAVMLMVAVKWQ